MRIALPILLFVGLSACGQKGPLYFAPEPEAGKAAEMGEENSSAAKTSGTPKQDEQQDN